jgi:hypothetical protein
MTCAAGSVHALDEPLKLLRHMKFTVHITKPDGSIATISNSDE